MSETKHVYQAISAVMADLAKEGIGKDRSNAQQGYKFRGIDDVYNALAPILCKQGLLLLPRYDGHVVSERGQTKAGATVYGATLGGFIDFVSIKDGSIHTVKVFGEASDQSDKATNKAMSAAYKYAAIQAFCIPTEGDNDADASHPEVAAGTKPTAKADEKLDGYKKQIAGASNIDELTTIASKLEQEPESVKAELRPLFKERRIELQGAK